MAAAHVNENVRYEPDDRPPNLVTVGAGFQAAMLIVAPVVLTVVIVARIATNPNLTLPGELSPRCWSAGSPRLSRPSESGGDETFLALLPAFVVVTLVGAIPPPVAAAYITVFIGMLFVQGMKIIIQDGVSDFLRVRVQGRMEPRISRAACTGWRGDPFEHVRGRKRP